MASFGAANDGEERPNRPKPGKKPKKAAKKKAKNEISKSMPNNVDFDDEETDTSQRLGARRIKKASSVKQVDQHIEASTLANSILFQRSDSEESSTKTLDIPLGLNVANNVTAYESEVEKSPKQTPLKKRLGFGKYFRGSARQQKKRQPRRRCRKPPIQRRRAVARQAAIAGGKCSAWERATRYLEATVTTTTTTE